MKYLILGIILALMFVGCVVQVGLSNINTPAGVRLGFDKEVEVETDLDASKGKKDDKSLIGEVNKL